MVVRRLAASIDPSQVDLHVVTMRPPWDDLSSVPATIHHVGFAGSRYRLSDRISIMWKMARWVRRLRPDVVQVHSGMAWLGGLSRVIAPRTPFVLEVHDAPGSGRHGAWTDRVEGWCIRWFGMTAVCHSSQVADDTAAATGVDRQLIHRFPLGIDTDRFSPVAPDERLAWRARNGLDPIATIAIAVGRPAPSKRFDLAVDTVLAARGAGADLELVITGGSRGDEALTSKVEDLDASDVIHLWGARFESEEDLVRAIASCDILCSTSEYEGFGLTLVEGMACGLPVVATAVGGVTDIVVDGVTGYLVDPGDIDPFTERLQHLADSAELRSKMGAAARERAESRFSLDLMAASFTGLYRELAATRHRGRPTRTPDEATPPTARR